MGGDPDDDEDADECRVVKRCLRKALLLHGDSKEVFMNKAERLVTRVSRLMHHGSLLATHYVLHLFESGAPPSDAMLCDQTFYRSCMMYAKSSTRRGAYPDVKDFADAKRGLIPDTPTEQFDGNCVNAAAVKLKTATLTMLTEQFQKRVQTAVNGLFRGQHAHVRDAIALRVSKPFGGVPVVLDREATRFVDGMRTELFSGLDTLREAVDFVVAVFGRGVSSQNKPVVAASLCDAGVLPEGVPRIGPKLREAAGHVAAFLPVARARASVPTDTVRQLVASRLVHHDQDAVDRVVTAVLCGHAAPEGHECLVAVAQSVFQYRGVVTKPWIKRHPSRALAALQHGRLACEAKSRTLSDKDPALKRFALLPTFGMRRQMVAVDADTLLSVLKRCGVLQGKATRRSLTPEFIQSVFRIPNNATVRSNVSVETDGVAVILRVDKSRPLPGSLPRAEGALLQGVLDRVDRVVVSDPGLNQPVTTAEWRPGGGVSDRSVRLTAKEYYSQAAVAQRVRYRKERDKVVARQRTTARSACLSVATMAEFESSLATRNGVVEDLWRHTLGRWTSRLRMEAYMRERSAVDRFWVRKVKLDADRPASRALVAFGDGSFQCTMRGKRHGAPLRKLERSAARFSALAFTVGERYTTKVCSRCHMPTVGVRRLRNGRRVLVQELRRCLSQACHSIPFKARDKDAALSILEIVLALLSGDDRPECYTRDGYNARVDVMRAAGVDLDDWLVN
eukprot:jgi/Tetstr1/454222/TSEL_041141.t1